MDFYPSISECLLNEAIDFAAQYTNISTHERHIIMQSKRTLLFSGSEPWTKIGVTGDMFDVTMGSFDGAETCELVVVLMLAQLKKITGKEIGLYRDIGLTLSHAPPRVIE